MAAQPGSERYEENQRRLEREDAEREAEIEKRAQEKEQQK